MLNEKTDIVVRGRKLTVEVEGLTELEINSLARTVEDRMKEIEREQDVADTQKLAILTALEFAAEIGRLKTQLDNQRLMDERKLDEMLVALQNALEAR